MTQRTLSSLRLTRNPERPGLRRFLNAAATALALVALLALGVLLLLAPGIWKERRTEQFYQAWNTSLVVEVEAVEKLLMARPKPSASFPGEPIEVEEMLAAHPTLMAILRRGAQPKMWVRTKEGRLSPEGPLGARYLDWTRRAEASGLPRWHPGPEADPEFQVTPTILLVGPEWVFIKRWIIGSPEAEQHLRLALGPNPKARLGIWLAEGPHPAPADLTPFAPPHLQTWPGNAMKGWNVGWISTDLGPVWEMVCQPWPKDGEAWLAVVRSETRMAWVAVGAIILSLAAGLLTKRSLLRREALAADRLASLTHSLKTPLALHKLRCDSLRIGKLTPAQANDELMRLGQDVDDLTRLIERALAALPQRAEDSGEEPIRRDWVEAVVEDLRPAFQEAGRELLLDLSPEGGRAHPDSLHSALQTLLENAYYHGAGTVRVSTRPGKRRLVFEIADQGPGMDAETLAMLGTPFLRVRTPGQEGFAHPGQGLGLSLLVQVARQEGWGFHAESRSGEGLTMRLEIPG